jgi:hypothetical protein
MTYPLTQEDIERANALIGDTPKVVGRRIIARIETERLLPRGCICNAPRGRLTSGLQYSAYQQRVMDARKDAIAEIYEYFLDRGKRLSTHQMASIFGLSHTTMHRVIVRRTK